MTQLPKGLVGLVDSKPDVALLIDLEDYYPKRALPEKGVDSDLVFEAPRAQLMVRTAVKGTRIGAHFHTVADEMVIVVGGEGELLINGVWIPVKRGAVHVCPRGIVHDTRAFSEHLRYLSVFTPHLPPGGDLNFVDVD